MIDLSFVAGIVCMRSIVNYRAWSDGNQAASSLGTREFDAEPDRASSILLQEIRDFPPDAGMSNSHLSWTSHELRGCAGGGASLGVRMSIGSDSQLTGEEPRQPVHSIASGEPSRILLALDDDSVARAAVRMTSALARPRNASVTVLRVVEVTTYCTAESFPELTNAEDLVLAADSSHSYRNELLRRVATLAGVDVDWHVVLELGNDARCIIRRAQAIGADLIVMGLEHHGLFARALAENTVRQVMASGVAPVLAVTKALEALPTRVVAGVDFTPSSIRAALLAGSLLDKRGSLDLVCVMPATNSSSRSAEARVDEDFAELITQFAPGTSVTSTRLYGRPADRLSAYAEEVGADLIAVGSHRYGLLERIRLGSVSAAVVRDARCSVLVAPPEPTMVT